MLFLVLLTGGFVYDFGNKALYFTNHGSAIIRPEK